MRKYKQIDFISLGRLNAAEKLYVCRRFMEILRAFNGENTGGDQGYPDVLSETGDIEELKISADEMERMDELIALLGSATKQGTGDAETPAMKEKDEERCRVVNYMVRKVLDGDNLPLAAERDAAKALYPEVKPYSGFYRLPLKQKTGVIDGFLEDIRKSQYSENVAALGFEPYITEAENLNNEYKTLDAARAAKRALRADTVTVGEITDEAQDLLDDMCTEANASVVFQPSDEVANFVRDINSLFTDVRIARNMRGTKGDETASEDENPVESDEPTVPDNDDDTSSGTEEPDDRPVVQ